MAKKKTDEELLNDQQEIMNVSLTINGYGLDPSKSYIIEVKRSEVDNHQAKGLVNALQQLGIKHVLVASESGKAFNVVEVPELAKDVA